MGYLLPYLPHVDFFIINRKYTHKKMKTTQIALKCKFHKKCPLYSKDNKTCNKDEGMYGSNFAGCFRYLEKREETENER